MSVSAVDRAPVEVWSNILAFTIRSPLVPHPDATLAQSMSLFPYGCASERLDRELVQIAGRLRQVCRSWDILVQRLQPLVVKCNFDIKCAEYVPSNVLPYPFNKNHAEDNIIRHELLAGQRLESWRPFECNCGQKCRSSLPMDTIQKINRKRFPSRLAKDPLSYLIPPQDLARVEVLIIAGYGGGEWPSNLFEHLPCLKALSWWPDWCRSFHDAVIQHSFHGRLTHLKVQVQWAHLYDLKDPLVFQHLHFLDLTVVNGVRCDAKPGHLDLVTWAAFPALRNLNLAVIVTGTVSIAEIASETERKRGEIRSLLSMVGPTLSGLTLDLPEEWKEWFTPDIWSFLPSLTEFGYKKGLPTADHAPPPEDMHSLDILYQFSVYALERAVASSGQTIFDDFIETCQKWRTKRITMLETWKGAEMLLNNRIDQWDSRRLPKRIDFYRRLGAIGVEICDRDGISVTEVSGSRFLEAVKVYEVRLQAWKPSDDDRFSRRRRYG